jgi:3-oxoacyl-[acyl-carrier protein] reductase
MNMDDEQFEEVLTTNLRSAFWLTRAVSRLMVRQRYGRIINIGASPESWAMPGKRTTRPARPG